MQQKTWPDRSDGPRRFTALPLENFNRKRESAADVSGGGDRHGRQSRSSSSSCAHASRPIRYCPRSRSRSSASSPASSECRDFSALPYDVVVKIAASFTLPDLRAASLVCSAWRDALRPLREAMLLLRWGKKFKHGRGGIRANAGKALDSFLKGAARGSTLAMVDAGLMYWEMGRKEEGIALYRKAAELGDPAGQCNLAIAFLQAEPSNPKEAVKWLYQASVAGHVRAQYQLAICLRQGRGVDRNLAEAARWYLRSAVGGYVRAMYNVSLCYSLGEGFGLNLKQAKKWMKRAADHGHSKALLEHGLGLFSEGDMVKAVVYLELATRAGERAAEHVKNAIFQQLPSISRDQATLLIHTWRPLPSFH